MINVLPIPQKVVSKKGTFTLKKSDKIFFRKELQKQADYLLNFLENLNFKLEKGEKSESTIILEISDAREELGEEGYYFAITQDGIIINARTKIGIFYGMQTLRQLLPKEVEEKVNLEINEIVLPFVEIIDYPRFQWRGFMLDVSRHFFGVEVIKKVLEVMALHKLNKFHWHLVDDQGWRIEIKKYPKLTEIGSKREIILERGEKPNIDEKGLYGGYFTQEQIREVVDYAAERFIEVIPEIEMPGHSRAALTAYPELSCTGGPFNVPTKWGVYHDVYCPGKEQTYEFLENVLDEVVELFPSDKIHIGGDEVPKSRWKKCSACKEKMIELGIKKVSKLHVHFTNHFADYLASKGKRIIGWNQILDDELVESAICQYWAGFKREVKKHMKKGRKVIATNYLHTYLDHPYKIISLKKAYRFEPNFRCLNEKLQENIIGLEPPLWTERVPTTERLWWQAFPRLSAYAETAWTSKEKKNYDSFLKRFRVIDRRLKRMGIEPATEKIK